MLLARYGYSEVLESHLTRMAVGFEEIGADAAVVDPKVIWKDWVILPTQSWGWMPVRLRSRWE